MDNKNDFLLHYIQTDSCWIVQETGEKIPFGEIIISMCNFNRNLLDNYNKEYSYILKKYGFNNERTKQFMDDNKLLSDNYDILDFMICKFERYLLHDHGKIENEKYKARTNSKMPEDAKIEIKKSYIKKVIQNGWHDVSENYDIPYIDILLLDDDLPSLPCTFHLIDFKWYPAYEVDVNNEDATILALIDLRLIRNQNLHISLCHNCNKLFIKQRTNNKYCLSCSADYKSINDKNRKNTPRGLHKKVSTYLRNSEKFSADEQAKFLNESNYYWDVLLGKIPKDTNKYTIIDNVQDYVKWLETKHKEFKEIAKNRKKCY